MSQRTESTAASEADPDPGDKRRGLARRTWTLIFSLVLVVVLGVVGAYVRVPYVAIGPGPTFDTLGKVAGTTVVALDGTKTYQPKGQLRMVTVSLADNLTLFGAVGMWLSGSEALAPRDEYFPPGKSDKQVQRTNVQEMRNSQSNAEVAALRYLHYPIVVRADKVVSGGPSDGKIRAGDRLLRVDGKKITVAADAYNALTKTKPGQVVSVEVRTPGQQLRTVRVTLGKRPDGRQQGFLGVSPVPHADVPFHIKISLADVGGPSAGMMFTLAVIDKLTPDNLAGGTTVAGTGTISPDGQVGPIGGIPFKMIAARDAGATTFLVPAKNCSEAKSKVPAGLRLVKVHTLTDAVHELTDLKEGKQVPGCS
ncbi:MAG: YlbL family protein [Sciscionella sp.]